jgi:hypothetical protein
MMKIHLQLDAHRLNFLNWFRFANLVSGVSAATGQKNGRSNSKRKLISDRINRMDGIIILKQKYPDNPVNPV